MRDIQYAAIEDNALSAGSHFAATGTPLFSIPLSLVRELNATAYLTGDQTRITAEGPAEAPLAAQAPAPSPSAQSPAGPAPAPSQSSGAAGRPSLGCVPLLVASGYAQYALMREAQ